MEHIFGECLVFIDVWTELMRSLQVTFKWDTDNLEAKLIRCKDLHPFLMDAPFATLWEIWRARNLAIF